MAIINYRWAVNNALDEEMKRDSTVFIIGEDVGSAGGTFGLTRGLHEKYGSLRVMDTPISEEGIAGLAVGSAAIGMRPVAEIMFMDFITIAMEQICNQAAKMRYVYGGQVKVPLVVRTLAGTGLRAGCHHSQSLESWFIHVPGLKVVMPSTPYDAKGLLKSAIRDDNPVIFIEHKALLGLKGEVPDDEYLIPLGKADIKKSGHDVTIVATGLMVHRALAAAQQLEQDGISAEVIDPRTLSPLDTDTIIASVQKTSRLIVVHDAVKPCGFGAEVAALVAEEAIEYLDAPIIRVTTAFTPIPVGEAEDFVIPSDQAIFQAVMGMFS